MSADNFISIRKKKGMVVVEHRDASSGGHIETIGVYNTHEEAIQSARKFMQENEVEYGIR